MAMLFRLMKREPWQTLIPVLSGVVIGVGLLGTFGLVRSSAPAHESAQPAPEPVNYHKYQLEVRAYCPCEKCCGKWADGYTASGKSVTANGGMFVAAGSAFEIGEYVLIPGYSAEPVPVLDRCGSSYPYCLEVFFFDHQDALNWGVRDVLVRHYQSE